MFTNRILAAAAATLVLASCAEQPATPVQAGPPASLQVVSGNGQSGKPGSELADALTVLVADSNGIPVKGQLVVYRVTRGNGSMYAGASITDSAGIARDRWTVGFQTNAPQTVEARAVDTSTGQRLLFGTFTATVLPDAPATVTAVSPTTQTGTVGYRVPTVQVRVFDTYGNPVPGTVVSWNVTYGGGQLSRAASVTDSVGIASIVWVMGTVVGGNGLNATVPGLPSVGFQSYAGPGTPVRVEISPDTTRVSGIGRNITLTSTGVDRYGNRFDRPLNYSSLDPSVVTVKSNLIRSAGVGTARVVGTIFSLADTAVVIVN